MDSSSNRGDNAPIRHFCHRVTPSVTPSGKNGQSGAMKTPKYFRYQRTHRSFCDYLNFAHYSNLVTYGSYYCLVVFYLTIHLFNYFFGWYNISEFVLHNISSWWLLPWFISFFSVSFPMLDEWVAFLEASCSG